MGVWRYGISLFVFNRCLTRRRRGCCRSYSAFAPSEIVACSNAWSSFLLKSVRRSCSGKIFLSFANFIHWFTWPLREEPSFLWGVVLHSSYMTDVLEVLGFTKYWPWLGLTDLGDIVIAALTRKISSWNTRKKNSISSSNHVLFCFLYQHLTNRKKLTFQKEKSLLFIHGAKQREWHVSSWLAISNTREKLS